MKHTLRRGVVATAVVALGAGLLGAAPAAQADTSRTPQAVNAADWLSRGIVDGVLHNQQYDFDDWGLTIDALLSLQSIGGYRAKVADIADALGDHLGDYVGTGGDRYAGSVAKSLVAAQAAGRDATSFGGTNLVTDTEALVDDTTGRLADVSQYGDFANVFGQAYAVRGLATAGSPETATATGFLLEQQCENGGFRLDLTEDKTAAEQGCTDPAQGQVDATAIAVEGLASQAADATVQSALDRAGSYLEAQQDASGGFRGGPSTEGVNTNSTAVATVALELVGRDDAAARAAAWIVQRQVSAYSACGTELDGEQGAVAYDDAALASAEDTGIGVPNADQWARATAPAIAALASYQDPEPLPRATFTVRTASGYVASDARTTVTVTGMAAGERYCVYSSEGLAARAGRADAEGKATITVTAPSAGTHPVYVYGERDSRSGQGTLKVLASSARFPASVGATKVKVNGKVRVNARGLAPGEPVRVYYRSRYVATGKASSTGRFTTVIGVGPATGRKTVFVRGLTNTRQGTATLTVVR
ncbi:MAG: terpene cyclase/mutase family protein [Aeromicrobium erythreum]